MDRRPYHHGDLRAALLAQAETTLRASGVDSLSLRELARAVGVSHAAPRRHFADRAALLEALVADGFLRLGSALETAAELDHRTMGDVLRAVAGAYLRFATDNPPLIDLMSQSRYLADASDALVLAREVSFAPVRKLVERGQEAGELAMGDVHRTGILIFAMLHGLATMANNRMVDPSDESLIVDGVQSLLTGLRAPPPGT